MKWVTREKARVDRIACPWLISRFIDKEPTFLFVPSDQVKQVAAREGATPYDIPGVELGHHGERCSFDAFLEKYKLEDPALKTMALIVRGADTDARQLTPESRVEPHVSRGPRLPDDTEEHGIALALTPRFLSVHLADEAHSLRDGKLTDQSPDRRLMLVITHDLRRAQKLFACHPR